MALFAYKGRNPRGELVEGTLDAASAAAVADQLITISVTPIEIRPAPPTAAKPRPEWLKRLSEPRIGPLDVLLFSRQMHTLLKAGVPILRALAGLQESTSNRSFAQVLRNLRQSLDSGRELSVAMRREGIFSPFYVAMVRVGEMTGRLDEIFLRLFHHLDFERRTREQIKAALRYPAFVLIAMGLAIVIINLLVIPAFAKVYAGFGAQLPYVTRLLIGFSNFMVATWPLQLALLLFATTGVRLWIQTPRGRYQWDRMKLGLPVVGSIVRKATLARFARSLALAVRSGVPIVQGLSVVAKVVDNDYIAARIEQMRDGVERGETILRTAVASGVFTPVVLQMIAVGEETGAVDELMQEIADMYDREVEYEVKNLSAQIEPILIVGMGVLVLILALGVFLPIWDLGRAALGKSM
ncbi:type II secretion system F family protein [Thiobacter aerophilum]|uniref:Type II secretion system F family protein n=1 Tax=Thiobacter aerophilum TaxID=3121275 RepID=A0ABV0EFC4_9BURK